MKGFIVLSFLVAIVTDPGKISKINSLKSEARKAFASGDYKTAIEKYRYLTDSLSVNEDEIKLNLANAYFQENDTTNAFSGYQNLAGSSDIVIRSKANQQLGVLNNRQGKFEEALANFKQSIKADPANRDARYNYEMLKKKLEEKKKKEEEEQQKQDQKDKKDNKDQKNDQQKDQKDKQKEKSEQQKKDEQQKQDEKNKSDNKDEKSKEQQQKDEQKKKEEEEKKKEQQQDSKEQQDKEQKDKPQPSVSDKLQQMKISEDKAKMLLEAMKNQEVQYLQQNKRKATKPKDKGKPDW
jgi:Ca-activated chloride channel homolog